MSNKIHIIGGISKTQTIRYSLDAVVKMFSGGDYKKDYVLQREPGCLKEQDQGALINSMILHEDVDPIKLCEDERGRLWLIDGLQRLSSAEDYINNIYPISPNQQKSLMGYYETVDGKEELVEFDVKGKYFKELPPKIQRELLEYGVNIVINLNCDEGDMAYHIDRYNHTAQMNTNQKNFLCMIHVAKYIKYLVNNHRFFLDAGNYTESERIKGVLPRVVMEAMMLNFHFDKWAKGKKMNERLDEIASGVEFNIFEDELDRLTPIINKKTTGQLFNSKNSFIWFGAFHKFTELGLEDKRFADFLAAFQDNLHSKPFDEYDGESFDTYDSGKGTKDRKVVAAKLDMLEKLMKKYFNMVEDQPVKEEVATETVENITDEQEVVEVTNANVEETEVAAPEEIVENTIVEPHARTAEEIENDHILAFAQAEVDPSIEMEDVVMYKDFFDDYVRDDSHVKTVGNAVLVAMLAYAFQIERDDDLSDWLDIIGKRDDRYSQNDHTNFTYFKRDFDKYLAGLDGKNAA